MSLHVEIVFLLVTYIWGSIPYGYFFTKISTGKNILNVGSGNVGSTNVGRVAGRRWSVITQLFDMLKGLLPVSLCLFFLDENQVHDHLFVYLLALSAIFGHDFSIFLKFKGGKGVNTTLGASLLLAPFSVLVSVVVYFAVKWKFKYVSVGSLALATTLPTVELIIHQLTPTFYYLLFCMVLIFLVHRKNIGRLLENKEIPS